MYSDPLNAIIRKVNDHLVVVSCPLQVAGRYDLGARMMAMSYQGNNIIVYSPLPYGEKVKEAFKMITNSSAEEFNVTHVIIPNLHHNLVGETYKKIFPNTTLISTDAISWTDIKLSNDLTNQVLAGDKLSKIGIHDSGFLNNLELIYLAHHKNKEIVVLEKTSKTLFTCDSLLNLHSGTMEQYSPELGYPEGYTPLTGRSFILRWLHPNSLLWNYYFCPTLNRLKVPGALEGLKLVSEWDFVRIEVVHGDRIEKDAKLLFKDCFGLK